MRNWIGLLFVSLLLSACAYVDNSHPRNAIPHEQRYGSKHTAT